AGDATTADGRPPGLARTGHRPAARRADPRSASGAIASALGGIERAPAYPGRAGPAASRTSDRRGDPAGRAGTRTGAGRRASDRAAPGSRRAGPGLRTPARRAGPARTAAGASPGPPEGNRPKPRYRTQVLLRGAPRLGSYPPR